MYGEVDATVVGRNPDCKRDHRLFVESVLQCKSLGFNELNESPLPSGIVGIDVAHSGSGPERRLRK
jgi:hypothetical protein